MITDKQVEAALAAFDPMFSGRIDDAHANMWRIKMRAAIEAAEKAAWMPISEAKSGQTVLAGYRNSSGKWRTVRAEFIGKFTREHTEECGLDPDYSEEADTFYWPEGWYERIESWDDFTHLVMHKNPAHFRPLPKGPSDEWHPREVHDGGARENARYDKPFSGLHIQCNCQRPHGRRRGRDDAGEGEVH